MTIAKANRESLGFIAEVTFGTNPGGNQQLLNYTSNTLKATNEEKNSNFVRSDTNVAGTIRTGRVAGGDIGIELQYGAYDSFLEGALRGAFATALAVTATDISAASSDNSINSAGAGFGNAVANSWIKISGFATSANNGYAFVVSKTSSKLVLSGITLVNESATPSVRVRGAYLVNSTTQKSFVLERGFLDISKYGLLTGQRVGEFGLNFNTADIATGTIKFTGKEGVVGGSSGFSGTVAASTNKSMNTVDNIKAIFINKALSTLDFMDFSFNITTNPEALKKIGALTAVDVKQGSIGVTGSIGAYYEDDTFLDVIASHTSVDLAVAVEDDDGNGYIYHFPEIFINGGADNQGINTVLQQKLTFNAVLDATTLSTMSVSKYPL